MWHKKQQCLQTLCIMKHYLLYSAVEHQEQGLKLTENVAYGTAKPTDPLHHEALPSAVEHHLGTRAGVDRKCGIWNSKAYRASA